MADLQTDAPAYGSHSGHARPRARAAGPSPRALIGGLVAAVAVGVAAGLLTAPSAKSGSTGTAGAGRPVVSNALLSPAPSALGQQRRAGAAVNVDLDSLNRAALQFAFYQAYLQGSLAGMPTGLQGGQVQLVSGSVHYGVVEGATAAQDAWWAVGEADFQGATGVAGTAARYVWTRTGTGPWRLVGGASACEQVPQALRTTIAVTC